VADAIKISELTTLQITPTTNLADDFFVVNEVTANASEAVTKKLQIGEYLNWILGQDLTFSQQIDFDKIKVKEGEFDDITTDEIYIGDQIIIGPNATVIGLDIADIISDSVDGLGAIVADLEDSVAVLQDSVAVLQDSVSAMQAELIGLRDSVSTLQDSIVSLKTDKLDDAPSDGEMYVRKDGAWIVLTNNLSYDS